MMRAVSALRDRTIVQMRVRKKRSATADKQIKQFKNLLRGTASRILPKETADTYLSPAKASKDVLLGLATNGKHAQLNCNVHISAKEQQDIAHAFVMAHQNSLGSQGQRLHR